MDFLNLHVFITSLLSSSLSSHGHFAPYSFKVFTNCLICSQSTPADSGLNYLLRLYSKKQFLILYYSNNLTFKIPNISLGQNITVSKDMLVTSNVAEFLQT